MLVELLQLLSVYELVLLEEELVQTRDLTYWSQTLLQLHIRLHTVLAPAEVPRLEVAGLQVL